MTTIISPTYAKIIGNKHGSYLYRVGLNTPLHFSARRGHLEVVKFLVEHGADIHAGNGRVLRLAAEYGRPKIVEYLTSLKKE